MYRKTKHKLSFTSQQDYDTLHGGAIKKYYNSKSLLKTPQSQTVCSNSIC